MPVYFVQAGDAVKIGCAKDPVLRKSFLQCGSPIRMALVAVVDGTESDEAAYHDRFAEHHLTGEWFRLAPEIAEEIDRHRYTPPPRKPPSREARLALDFVEIEARLKEAGVSVAAVCRRADMSQSTWWRWREGRSKPTARMWARVEAALPENLRGNA